MERVLLLRPGRRVKPKRWMPSEWTKFVLVMRTARVVLQAKRGIGITGWTLIRIDGAYPLWDNVSWVGDLLVKKRTVKLAEGLTVPHLAAVESVLLGKHHSLVAHCADTSYDDGTPRLPGWWTVKTMGSAWIVEVKDPDTCCRLVVVQQTLDDALTLASLLLDAEEAPWEPDPWLTAAKAKRKK